MLQIVKWRLLSSGPEYCKYKVKQLIFIICQISSKRFEYHDSSSSPVILSKRGMFLSLTTISSFNMQTINSENSVTFWHRLGLQYNDFQKIPVAQIQVLLLRIKTVAVYCQAQVQVLWGSGRSKSGKVQLRAPHNSKIKSHLNLTELDINTSQACFKATIRESSQNL